MKKTILEQLGLNDKQIKIYKLLLKFGSCGVSDIARLSRLYRHDVYRELPELVRKGLLSQSPFGKRMLYVAESPRSLTQLVEKIQRELERELPELLENYSRGTHHPHIRYFEGDEGIRAVYKDLVMSLKKGDIFCRYESPQDNEAYRKYVPQEYFDRFRDKAEVDRLVITNESTRRTKKQRLGRFVKAVPPSAGLFNYDITQFIYNDKVAFIDYRAKVASIIESDKIAEFQRKIFKLLFERL